MTTSHGHPLYSTSIGWRRFRAPTGPGIGSIPAVSFAFAIILYAFDAASRPGGGHTYSGGGSESGSGGGGSDGGGGAIFLVIRLLLELCIQVPVIGIPLVLALIIGFGIAATRQRSNRDWNGPPRLQSSRAKLPRRRALLTWMRFEEGIPISRRFSSKTSRTRSSQRHTARGTTRGS
jgi:hypothetical protein